MTYSPTLSPEYRGYIKSKKWQRRKAAYWRKHKRQCWACDSTRRVQLHHVFYGNGKKWGNEPDSWFVPLCAYPCHAEVTAISRKRPGQLQNVTMQYVWDKRKRLGLPKRRLAPLPWPIRLLKWWLGK